MSSHHERPLLVLVGGVPGAGKTTALERVRRDVPGVRVADPERWRAGLARGLGPAVPYRVYRPLVHALHGLVVLRGLLAGPRRLGGRAFVVHEPGTRPRRNAALARLARARGWSTAAVFVDVDRTAAVAGQHDRGRVVAAASFGAHWARWSAQREEWRDAAVLGTGRDGWDRVVVVPRDRAAQALLRLLAGTADARPGTFGSVSATAGYIR